MSIIGAVNSGYGAVGFFGSPGAARAEDSKPILNPSESTEVQPGRKSSPAECQTCKERKYQDGSDEMVSFKTAQHISPQAAAARVRGHEAEHVSNAYKDAAMNNGKVLQASVSIKTAICPECGRTYVSGGTTATKIKYTNEENPYQQARKSLDRQGTVGANIDLAG
ncbi:hypothetical protein [Butyrivibrio sp. MC2021]|jgi:hypothetical protein|uniref:hypothetical protein n=1 Tax=Butyrivibrio sp. MC2021 TaxID=1408306 RepID=UPI00047E0CC8|nr:hypothetical protein [Butyrivibrio sp. MC2021]